MLVLNVAGTDENAHGMTSLPKVASDREVLPHLWRPFKVIWRLLLAEGFLPDSAEAGRSSVCILGFMLWDL